MMVLACNGVFYHRCLKGEFVCYMMTHFHKKWEWVGQASIIYLVSSLTLDCFLSPYSYIDFSC